MGKTGSKSDARGAGGGSPTPAPELDLVGSQSGSLDAKRRLAIPKAFREQIAAEGSYVVCRELQGEGCLALYPPGRFEAAFARLTEGLRDPERKLESKTVRAYLRKIRLSAARITPDRQARITLSEEQCQLAGITKEVALVGSGDHLELWAPERLKQDDETIDFGALVGELFG